MGYQLDDRRRQCTGRQCNLSPLSGVHDFAWNRPHLARPTENLTYVLSGSVTL